MPGRGTDLLAIPDPFWQRPETIAALRERAMGKLLLLIHQHTGASQTQIATACGTTQPKISDLIRGVQKIKSLAVFARYADALNMPDPARAILGVAPKATVSHQVQRQARQRGRRSPSRRRHYRRCRRGVRRKPAGWQRNLIRNPSACLWRESLEIARAANRPALVSSPPPRAHVRTCALDLAERTRRPSVLSDLYVVFRPGHGPNGLQRLRPQPLE